MLKNVTRLCVTLLILTLLTVSGKVNAEEDTAIVWPPSLSVDLQGTEYRCFDRAGYAELSIIYDKARTYQMIIYSVQTDLKALHVLIGDYELQLELEKEANQALLLENEVLVAELEGVQKNEKGKKLRELGLWATVLLEATALVVVGVAAAR